MSCSSKSENSGTVLRWKTGFALGPGARAQRAHRHRVARSVDLPHRLGFRRVYDEFALFDIESAARLIRPGGFVIIDNVSQAGPYFAARDFLRNHPRWYECGHCIDNYRPEFPFDPHRTTIINTDACALRAPTNYFVGDRPTTRGQQIITAGKIDGISLAVAQPATGTLYLQCVVRVFGTPPTEATIEHTLTMSGAHGATRLPLQWKFDPKDVQFARTAELWLGWQGDRELELAEEPHLF